MGVKDDRDGRRARSPRRPSRPPPSAGVAPLRPPAARGAEPAQRPRCSSARSATPRSRAWWRASSGRPPHPRRGRRPRRHRRRRLDRHRGPHDPDASSSGSGSTAARVDGDRGPKTNAGLSAAFDGESWLRDDRHRGHTRSCKRRRDARLGRRHAAQLAELFRDGVLDVTFGIGFFEGDPPAEETRQVAKGVDRRARQRGYTEDANRAAELLEKAGPPAGRRAPPAASSSRRTRSPTAPPAGTPRSIHSIVRVVFNDVAGGGGKTAAAFRRAMTQGDAVWYSGHGRYGTGPDFDRNFIEFRLYDAAGNARADARRLRRARDRPARGRQGPVAGLPAARSPTETLQVDLSNAGNVRLVGAAHDNEFGAKLINWALEQSGTQVADRRPAASSARTRPSAPRSTG